MSLTKLTRRAAAAGSFETSTVCVNALGQLASINPPRPAAINRETSLHIRCMPVLKFIDKWQEWSRTKLRRVRILSRNEVVPSENNSSISYERQIGSGNLLMIVKQSSAN
jgi:hypothetical protein